MLRRIMVLATLAVGIAIGSCDSPTGEGGVLGTEPISGSPAAASPRLDLLTASSVGTIGCVARGSGMLRIVQAADTCRDNEDMIVLGGGLAGYEVVSRDEMFANPAIGGSGTLSVECPAGKRVLGGGAGALRESQSGSIVLSHVSSASFAGGSYPAGENAWRTSYTSTGGDAVGVRGFAVCAY